MVPVTHAQRPSKGKGRRLESLVGHPPDPDRDAPALRSLVAADSAAVRRFGAALRTDPRWRDLPLRELFPGVDLIDPTPFWERLSVRACNLLRRSGFTTWQDVCDVSAGVIEGIYGAGPEVVEDSLRAAASEWAAAYLACWESAKGSGQNGGGPESGLRSADEEPIALEAAFVELEEMASFKTYEQRRLRPGPPPTYRAMAAERGRSGSLMQSQEKDMERRLRQQLEDPDWPIAQAVGQLKKQLVSLAHPAELERALAALHRETGALHREMPQRRALLLDLAQYRVTEEWILGPDVEKLTIAVINAFAGGESVEVEAVAPHLSTFGIREHLQLPWLAGQHGYRILDGRLVPVEH